MDLIGFLLLGLIAGAIARLLMPGSDPMGIVGTMVLGVVGALLGGYLGRALFNNNSGVHFVGAVVGSLIVLFVYRVATRGNSRTI